MTDETTDSVDLCRATVRDVVHLARLNLLRGHERRTLLDALGGVDSYEMINLHASMVCEWTQWQESARLTADRAERAERERDRYREALERIQDPSSQLVVMDDGHPSIVPGRLRQIAIAALRKQEPSRTGGALGWCPTHEREDRCCDAERERQ